MSPRAKKEIGRYRPSTPQIKDLCTQIFRIRPEAFEVFKEGDYFVVRKTKRENIPDTKNRLEDIKITRESLAASLNTDSELLTTKPAPKKFIYARVGRKKPCYEIYVSKT